MKWHYLSNLFLLQYFFKLLSNVNNGLSLIFDMNYKFQEYYLI